MLAYITHATLEETGWMFNNPTSSSWTHNNHLSQPLSEFRKVNVNWFWPTNMASSTPAIPVSLRRLLSPD